ncbi:SCP2 sterol-binding domain-containing protein [Granulosicoccaceae sp. 1_MG-2023]|nr:SCP2 sterol-binding domain-containing protein [Granulosicoccaceae sp. 1_MG-2023]
MKIPQLLIQAVEQAANALIRLDEDSAAGLKKLAGKVICIHLQGLELSIFLFVHADEIEVLNEFDGEVDTTISGSPGDLMGMRSSKRALFSGDVEISGDVETGKAFSRFLDKLDIDWEEHLSRLIGDTLAYQLGRFVRSARGSVESTLRTAQQNAGEYIAEESGLGTAAAEVEEFNAGVDTLREDLDRLSARVDLIEKSLKDLSS